MNPGVVNIYTWHSGIVRQGLGILMKAHNQAASASHLPWSALCS